MGMPKKQTKESLIKRRGRSRPALKRSDQSVLNMQVTKNTLSCYTAQLKTAKTYCSSALLLLLNSIK